MQVALHAGCLTHSNLATQVQVVSGAGFDGIELQLPTVERYIDAGFTADDLVNSLGPLSVTMFDVLLGIERSDTDFRRGLRTSCARFAALAAAVGCSALQVVALDDFHDADWPGRRRRLVSSLNELADIAEPYGVRLALEPVTFSRFRSIEHVLEVTEIVGRARVGLVLDTWHLWTSHTPWEEVARLDPSALVCAHLSDSKAQTRDTWSDADRAALPGDGVVPLREGVDAIRATGFDGVWSVEMHSPHHAEWLPAVLATELLDRAQRILAVSG